MKQKIDLERETLGVLSEKQKNFSVKDYLNRFFHFLENIEEGIFVIDANSRDIIRANQTAANLTGYTKSELEKLSIDDLHQPDELPLLFLEIQRLEFEHQTEINEFALIQKNGWKVMVDIRLCRLVQEEENFYKQYCIAYYHDLKDQVQSDNTKRNEELLALMEVGQTIASALNLDEIIDLTMLKIASVCNASFVSIFLKDEVGGLKMYKAHKTPPDKIQLIDQPWRIGIEEGPYDLVNEQNKTLKVENILTEDSFSQWRPIAERIGYRALLSLAMIPRDISVGVFNVYYDKPKKFTEDEIDFLRTAITYLSISIENARLYKDYQEKADQISAINEITNSINSSLELKEVIETVTFEVKKIINFDYMSISLFDEDSDNLNIFCLVSEQIGRRLQKGYWHRLRGSSVGWLNLSPDCKKNIQNSENIQDSVYETKLEIENQLQSKINVLLLSKDKYLGTFSIGKVELNAYNNTQQTLFKQIAGQVATALENAKLYQEAKLRLKELSALEDVSKTISSSLNIREVLDLIVKAAATVMYAKICTIWFVGEVNTTSRFSSDVNDTSSTMEFSLWPKVEKIIKEQRPLVIEDLHGDNSKNSILSNSLPASNLRSYLGVPVISRGKTIAVLGVYKDEIHRFDDREIKLLDTIANQAAIAIENARLYESERRRAAQLAMVNEVGKKISSTLDPDKLLKTVTASIQDIFNYNSVSVYLVDRETKSATLQSQSGVSSKIPKIEFVDQHQRNPIALTIRTAETTMIKDFTSEGELENGFPAAGSLLCIPLKIVERVNGCLCLYSDRKKGFDKRDLYAFEALASQLASAIENARLFEETKINSEKLSQVNEELENFVFSVSHDLKSPIVSILGFSTILKSEFSDKLDPEGIHYLDRINANIKQMENLIQDLLELSKIGRIATPFEMIDINEIVKTTISNLQFQIQKKEIKIQYPNDFPEMNCDWDRIQQVFTNLIDNAIKYIGDNPNPKIEIGHKIDDDFFLFFVRDNGIGIEKKFHDKIFELFQSLKEIEGVEGTGVGLTIVKKIIEKHNGRVWLESRKGRGTCFYFSIPKSGS